MHAHMHTCTHGKPTSTATIDYLPAHRQSQHKQ
jgi:hypothetical protein